MSRKYFRQVPDFQYVSRLPNATISDYITVKNLFKRGKLKENVAADATLFTKYQVRGDDRPDNVAFKFYGDENLDWLVMLSNNIINLQNEWPLLQVEFDRYLIDKYETYEKLNEVHHYETIEVKSSTGVVIVPAGLTVDSDYSVTYFDWIIELEITENNIVTPITNLEYEEKLDDEKRNIFLLKQEYIGVIKGDIDNFMPYKKGSTEYVSKTLKKAENIKLYS
tara:strand:+ start:1597 stop:2265 length:669 start_codon:yes stop_codon:yes gene_type:complete